jgi:hypothetical protein
MRARGLQKVEKYGKYRVEIDPINMVEIFHQSVHPPYIWFCVKTMHHHGKPSVHHFFP